jgi:hypothetical protein
LQAAQNLQGLADGLKIVGGWTNWYNHEVSYPRRLGLRLGNGRACINEHGTLLFPECVRGRGEVRAIKIQKIGAIRHRLQPLPSLPPFR